MWQWEVNVCNWIINFQSINFDLSLRHFVNLYQILNELGQHRIEFVCDSIGIDSLFSRCQIIV